MKTRNLFVVGLAAVSMLFASCSKNEVVNPVDHSQPATMRISVVGESAKTKAVGTPTEASENKLFDYTVYVFNATTNKLQHSQLFVSGTNNLVTNLTSGPKKVVVIANHEGIPGFHVNVGDDYSVLDSQKIALDFQTHAVLDMTGLVMSGETTVTLNPGSNVISEPLVIKRVVAKVKLGSVTISPEAGHDGVFTLNGVNIMKARSEASFGPNQIYTGPTFYGGIMGTVSTERRSFLSEYITNADNSDCYFYVYPNDNTDGNATMLTLEGTYNGSPVYFPIRINDAVGVGGSTTDGSFIKRNYVYTINVTIKRPGDGSVDPEIPVSSATLDLTIQVQNWAGELIQNVEM